jgi:hypothetical protein
VKFLRIGILFVPILTAIFLGYLGEKLSKPQLYDWAGICIALTFMFVSLDTILRRKYHVWFGIRIVETYHGFSAVLRGVSFFLISLLIFTVCFMRLINLDQVLVEKVLDRPGLFIVIISFILLSLGGAYLLGSDLSQRDRVIGFGAKLGGTILVLIGLITLSLGAMEITAPITFDHLLESIFNEILNVLHIGEMHLIDSVVNRY